MGVKARRKNFKIGGSTAFTIPSDMTTGEDSTLAADRIMLVDPEGKISPDELEEFLETHIEPIFWKWHAALKERNESQKSKGLSTENPPEG